MLKYILFNDIVFEIKLALQYSKNITQLKLIAFLIYSSVEVINNENKKKRYIVFNFVFKLIYVFASSCKNHTIFKLINHNGRYTHI